MKDGNLVAWQAFFIDFINNINLNFIYDSSWQMASQLLFALGGTLWVCAFIYALVQEMSKGQPNYGDLLKKHLFSGLILIIYASFWYVFFNILSYLWSVAENTAGIKAVFALYAETLNEIKAIGEANQEDSFINLPDFNPLEYIVFAAYFVFFLVLMVVYATTKIFHALVIGVAIVWGVVVFPLRSAVDLVKGWWHLVGLSIFWVFFEIIFMAFLVTMLEPPMNALVESMKDNSMMMVTSDHVLILELVMTFANIIAAALLIFAPVFASKLLSNASVGTAIGAGMGVIAKMTQDQANKSLDTAKDLSTQGAGKALGGLKSFVENMSTPYLGKGALDAADANMAGFSTGAYSNVGGGSLGNNQTIYAGPGADFNSSSSTSSPSGMNQAPDMKSAADVGSSSSASANTSSSMSQTPSMKADADFSPVSSTSSPSGMNQAPDMKSAADVGSSSSASANTSSSMSQTPGMKADADFSPVSSTSSPSGMNQAPDMKSAADVGSSSSASANTSSSVSQTPGMKADADFSPVSSTSSPSGMNQAPDMKSAADVGSSSSASANTSSSMSQTPGMKVDADFSPVSSTSSPSGMNQAPDMKSAADVGSSSSASANTSSSVSQTPDMKADADFSPVSSTSSPSGMNQASEFNSASSAASNSGINQTPSTKSDADFGSAEKTNSSNSSEQTASKPDADFSSSSTASSELNNANRTSNTQAADVSSNDKSMSQEQRKLQEQKNDGVFSENNEDNEHADEEEKQQLRRKAREAVFMGRARKNR